MSPLPAVLREEPQFRLFFLGQALSLIGDRITFVAMPFAVLAAGGDVTALGLVVAAQTVPFAVLSIFAGVWADRLDRRRIMIASDLVRMGCQLLAGGLLVGGAAEPWHLGVIGAVYGAADAFFSPAMTGLLPQVVPPHHLQSANALRSLTMSIGLVLGPAIAGVLIALVGTGGALLADAATFAVSVGFLLRLRPGVAERAEDEEPDFLRGLREGWREVRSRSWVMTFLAAMVVYHLIVLPSVFVLGPVIAESDYGGAKNWALVTASFGLGSVIGNVVLLRWRPRRPLRTSAVMLIFASCQAAIIGSGMPIEAIAALEGVAGVAVSLFFVLWETTLQEHVPERSISRVSSYDWAVNVGLMPIGVALAGPVSEGIGLRTTMFAMTAIGISAALFALSVPSVRRLGRAASREPAAA